MKYLILLSLLLILPGFNSIVEIKGARKLASEGRGIPAIYHNCTEALFKFTNFDSLIKKSKFIRNNTYYDPATLMDRRSWIAMAKANQKGLYAEIENGALKRLNDLGDKSFVTAITNYHKRSFEKKFNELTRYSGLDIYFYSDFKSIRIFIKSLEGPLAKKDQTRFEKIIQEAFDEANLKTLNMVNNFKSADELESGFKNEDPVSWFSAGFGQTADEASITARFGRSRGDGKASRFKDINVQKSLESKFNQIKKLKKLLNDFDFENLDLIDFIRKNLEEDSFFEKINNAFDQSFKRSEVNLLKGYFKVLKSFEPAIWKSSREIVSFDNAVNGAISVDFAQVGAMNLRQISKDIEEVDVFDSSTVLSRLREGEVKVSGAFNKRKSVFKNQVNFISPDGNLRVSFSGDDGGIIIPKDLKESGEDIFRFLLSSISFKDRPSAFRMVYLSPEIEEKLRSKLIGKAELMEKKLRSELFGNQDKGMLSRSDGKNIIFGIIIRDSNKFDLVIGSNQNIESAIRNRIKRVFKNLIDREAF